MSDELYRELLRQTYKLAAVSRDPSTQNAAKLIRLDSPWSVNLWNVNQFPAGVQELPERWERPEKYSFIEHAERNVIYTAARAGVKTDGLAMVCCWAACTDCARAIVQAGIKTLITHREGDNGTWGDSIRIADDILKEGGVEVIVVAGKIDDKNSTSVLRNGKEFYP